RRLRAHARRPNQARSDAQGARGVIHDRRRHSTVHFHVGRLHRLRGHLARAGHSAHAAHVRLQFRAWHRAGRRHGGAGRRGHHPVARQRRRRLCGDRAHAEDVRHRRPQEGIDMLSASTIQTLTQLSYLVAAALFILGLKRMSSPVTAVSGVRWAGAGMVLATAVTLAFMSTSSLNLMLVIGAIAAGGILAWISGKRVAMTNMPQMIALYNGMGGGAAAAIAAVELYRGNEHSITHLTIATVGGFIGSVSFSGSLIAFAKLQGLIKKSVRFGGQKFVNLGILLVTAALGVMVVCGMSPELPLAGLPAVSLFFAFALLLGVAMTLPIGGADMPVVISLYNALTGLAVGFEGFVLNNAAMIIAGTVVGSAGTLLTQLMAKAMNRSLGNVLFSGFGDTGGATTTAVTGTMKPIEASDV